jgi:hypothetical protein
LEWVTILPSHCWSQSKAGRTLLRPPDVAPAAGHREARPCRYPSFVLADQYSKKSILRELDLLRLLQSKRSHVRLRQQSRASYASDLRPTAWQRQRAAPRCVRDGSTEARRSWQGTRRDGAQEQAFARTGTSRRRPMNLDASPGKPAHICAQTKELCQLPKMPKPDAKLLEIVFFSSLSKN